MKKDQRKKLESAGWVVGSDQEEANRMRSETSDADYETWMQRRFAPAQ